ncbi:DUF5719 family protein [Bifidobacterium platyrrhinorum]|uniref:Organic solvents resistance ABC transporter permease n=1 Tax=Bifidobacterium platyrrhinorum TaxID=2661628 RepID=A0A6L9SU71_9BIFI|nr:DUF5719 family protein [Bifidobacterium platyrrhinorum]NEG55699.1 hypothetical protein [Bifidobacterium platyrrhinorum]
MKHANTPMKALRIILAVVTSALLLAAFALMAVVKMPQIMVDAVPGGVTSSHRIVQHRLEAYCPGRMQLSDSTDWGDSDYRASSGDIASSTALAAFGSVYASTSSPLDLTGGGSTVSLKAPDKPTSRDAMVVRDDGDYSRLLSTNLLKAGDGSGHAGVIASHASDGDLRGISAATCVTPSMKQTFLLGATTTGTSQQLVLANPSSKATTVSIEITGSKSSGPMSLATAGSATVGAESETVVDLSAAASGQDGLYVTVTSGATPVGAVVRTTSSSGLTPKGSDFAMPAGDTATLNAIPSVSQGDHVRLYLYGEHATDATLSWVTDDGLSSIRKEQVKGERVGVFDLGTAPRNAHGILVTSDEAVVAAAKATRSGSGGQEDFALLAAAAPAASSGMALPDGVDSTLVLVNTGNDDVTVSLTMMGDDGKAGDAESVDIKANSAVTVDGKGTAAMLDDETKTVAWGVRLSGGGLDQSKTAGLSAVTPTALAVREETVRSTPDASIVG